MAERAKKPAYQWYPGDFRRDTALLACSFDARAVWREMLDLMHDGEPRGHLTAGGVAIEAAALARMIGAPLPRVRKALAELEAHGVFSRTEAGIIYSRRMVRDEAINRTRAEVGKLGGNPALLVNQKPTEPPTKSQPLLTATAVALAPAVAEVDQSAVESAAIELAVAANQGLSEHPTRPEAFPLIIASQAKTQAAARSILEHGVPLEFAKSAVYEVAKSHNADDRVTSLGYFVKATQRRWDQRGEVQRASTQTRPKLLPKNVSPEARAQVLVATIRAMKQSKGTSTFIPRDAVAELGPDVLAAYEAIGGASVFLATSPEKLSFLVRDFARQLQGAA